MISQHADFPLEITSCFFSQKTQWNLRILINKTPMDLADFFRWKLPIISHQKKHYMTWKLPTKTHGNPVKCNSMPFNSHEKSPENPMKSGQVQGMFEQRPGRCRKPLGLSEGGHATCTRYVYTYCICMLILYDNII